MDGASGDGPPGPCGSRAWRPEARRLQVGGAGTMVAQVEDAIPFVSVIIPAYDAVSFVPQAVASALEQHWPSRK